MKTIDLISCLHSKILKQRAILRIIESDTFRDIFDNCADTSTAEYYIETLRIEELKQWLKSKIKMEIEEMSIYQLRSLAKDLGVKRYNFLNKEGLIYRIRQLKGQDYGSKISH